MIDTKQYPIQSFNLHAYPNREAFFISPQLAGVTVAALTDVSAV